MRGVARLVVVASIVSVASARADEPKAWLELATGWAYPAGDFNSGDDDSIVSSPSVRLAANRLFPSGFGIEGDLRSIIVRATPNPVATYRYFDIGLGLRFERQVQGPVQAFGLAAAEFQYTRKTAENSTPINSSTLHLGFGARVGLAVDLSKRWAAALQAEFLHAIPRPSPGDGGLGDSGPGWVSGELSARCAL